MATDEICPLLSLIPGNGIQTCIEARCAWYTVKSGASGESGCAIVQVAESLDVIEYNSYKEE